MIRSDLKLCQVVWFSQGIVRILELGGARALRTRDAMRNIYGLSHWRELAKLGKLN